MCVQFQDVAIDQFVRYLRQLQVAPNGHANRGEATGYCVRLPDWRYPVICNIESGQVKFDNFAGRWGQQCELDRLTQAYAIEGAQAEKHPSFLDQHRIRPGSLPPVCLRKIPCFLIDSSPPLLLLLLLLLLQIDQRLSRLRMQ